MSKNGLILISVIICTLFCYASAEPKLKIKNIVLQTADGNGFDLYRMGSHYKALVLISHVNGCPILRKYSKKINKLQEKYKGSVGFYLINSNIQDSPLSIKIESENIQYKVSIIVDKSQQLSKDLKLTRASEAVILDTQSWEVIYRGAIDDSQNYDLDKDSANKNYLEDNISHFLNEKKIIHQSNEAFGCSLYYDDSDVSYKKDIARIYSMKCLQCHNSGAISPDLTDYEKTKGWSEMSAEQIRLKKMPPVSLDIDSNYAQYDRPSNFILTAEEERKIFNWVQKKCAEGSGKIIVPKSKETKQITIKADHEFNVDSIEVPERGILPYKYQQISGPFPKDIWVQNVQFDSSGDYFHHAHLMFLPNPLTYYQKNKLMKDMHLRAKFVEENTISWSPSSFRSATKNWISFPKNTALLIPKNSYAILESHLKTTGRLGSTNLSIRLNEVKPNKKTKRIFVGYLSKSSDPNKNPVIIPAGENKFLIKDSKEIDKNISILRSNFHMHLRGVSFKMSAVASDKKEQTIFSIPNYSYKKLAYVNFEKPFEVQKGSTIEILGEYDNSKYNLANPEPNADVKIGGDFLTEEMLKAEYWYILR